MKRSVGQSSEAADANFSRRIGLRRGASGSTRRTGWSGARANPAIRLHRILVPVDFSRASVKPLLCASAIATAHGAKIVLIHVTKPIAICVDCGYGPVNRQEPDGTQIRKDLSHLKKSAANHLLPDSIEDVIIRSGDASEQILRAAKEFEADMIVLYAHVANNSNSVASHKTAEKVMRSAECPVLVVPPHERDFVQPVRKRRRLLRGSWAAVL